MVYFRVCFCLGKTYDREMVLKSRLLEKRLWESGYKCLAASGFTVCDLFDDLSQAKVLRSLLLGQDQLSAEETIAS